MRLSLKYLLIFWLLAVQSIILLSQTTIDATVPIRNRLRKPTFGQGGSIGRRLPLQITLEFASQPNADESINVAFVLTNVSETDFVMPISPHPGDFEPQDASIAYTVQHLGLYVTSDNKPGSPLVGGADLYGNIGHPNTLLTVRPGDFVRVLARVRIPHDLAAPSDAHLFFGNATLNTETIRTVNRQTFEDSQEIGYARSPAYSLK